MTGRIIISLTFSWVVLNSKDICYSSVNKTEEKQENSTDDNRLTHFSSFAVSAFDGTSRWHHLPGDFGEIATNIKVCY